MLVDLRDKKLTGKIAEKALDEIGITVNKNTVPYETESPFVTSGIRIGTPAITSRGMKEGEMKIIAELIAKALGSLEDEKIKREVKEKVSELCRKFPLYK
ncbi:MAG: serine hydroxymethyltransferase, partial [Candidatus Saganbacteria bacterium]|nr:serine hydroxymethyltransferase [Candidatus Saganbacteria bacterium]